MLVCALSFDSQLSVFYLNVFNFLKCLRPEPPETNLPSPQKRIVFAAIFPALLDDAREQSTAWIAT